MPANRSRTERWKDCLHQIFERNGGLEISVDQHGPSAIADPDAVGNGSDLVWRVRILRITEREIVVERPAAMGQSFSLPVGTSIIAAMSVGQNRWMFRTAIVGEQARSSSSPGGLVLEMPEHVERCSRRSAFRVSTAELRLPLVSCWPLLDPASVVPAEVANKAAIMDAQNGTNAPNHLADEPALVLPEVGPNFPARLMNLGGGGVGLLIERADQSAAERSRLLWIRVDLRPGIALPIAMTARVVHVHHNSEGQLYFGAAFEFAFHESHRDFVVSQITRYVDGLAHRKAA